MVSCAKGSRGTMVELLTREGSTMPQARQGSQKRKASRAALHVWGAAGLSLAMAGSASANAPAVNGPSPDSGKRIVLSEEEIADVNLGTFYVFDREREASPGLRLAGGCHAGGCHGCGGCGCPLMGGCYQQDPHPPHPPHPPKNRPSRLQGH